MAIRLNHSVIPVSVKLGAPTRVSARSSLPFSVGDWRGVSTFSGARPLVLAKVKLRAESTEEDRVPIDDDDDSTDQLVSVEFHLDDSLVCDQNQFYSSFC
jgi:beta-amylase